MSNHTGGKIFPIFLTSEVPVEIINSLLTTIASCTWPSDCILLTTANTSPPDVSQLRSTQFPSPTRPPLVSTPSTPFLTHGPTDIYTYWKLHLRAPLDKPQIASPWTAFTFLILDLESASSGTVVVCSDGPDIGEPPSAIEEPVFKTRRLPFAVAADSLPALEFLSLCLSEITAETAFKLIPPASLTDWQEHMNEDGTVTFEGSFASPMEARKRKAEGLAGLEAGASGGEDSGARTLDMWVGEKNGDLVLSVKIKMGSG